MIEILFPAQIDNSYNGPMAAIWLFGTIVAMKLIMGLNVSGFNPWVKNRDVMRLADGIDVDSYGPEAAKTTVFLFSCWGLALLVLSLLGVVVVIRYRAMIPLIFLLLAIEQIGRKGLSLVNPVVRTGDRVSPGIFINWGLSAALVIGLILSLSTPNTD